MDGEEGMQFQASACRSPLVKTRDKPKFSSRWTASHTASIQPCTRPPTIHMVTAKTICTGTIQLFRLPSRFQNQASTIGL